MRMSRRMGLNSIVRFALPLYTGTYVISGDKKKGVYPLQDLRDADLEQGRL